MRDYTKYPVFSFEEIDAAFKGAYEAQKAYETHQDGSLALDMERKLMYYYSLIDANFAVIHGKKSVKDAHEAVSTTAFEKIRLQQELEEFDKKYNSDAPSKADEAKIATIARKFRQ